ncbi:MAG: hypothetical protein KA314_30145 [Chloroflexi bacterium]|nr:hypothetical protein [Chloroflexota bacterium]MBP8060121.1 hypothetical protein [Chloroflexota bacterium]
MLISTPRSADYYILMLKIWLEHQHQDDKIVGWRFSLEDPVTGARKSFVQVEDFLAYLQVQLQTIMNQEGNAAAGELS